MWAPRWRPRWAGDIPTRSECFGLREPTHLRETGVARSGAGFSAQHLIRRAGLDDAAAIEDDDAIGETPRFVAIVGHVEHWHGELVAHTFEVRQDAAA